MHLRTPATVKPYFKLQMKEELLLEMEAFGTQEFGVGLNKGFCIESARALHVQLLKRPG